MISSIETSSPPKPERRWPKHLLMAVVVSAILGTIASNLTARPSRSKRLLEKATHDGGDRASIDRLNAEFASHLDRQQLEACGEADWLTVCRRLNLGLAGCGLSLEDIRSLEKVPEEERIDYWLEFLLRDPRTFDYLAERFTRAFVGTNNGPFLLFRRRKFKLWLADELEKGVPYDRIVRQLISAEGLWTDKPAVNFITATWMKMTKGGRIRFV